jgi:hypothetical protein
MYIYQLFICFFEITYGTNFENATETLIRIPIPSGDLSLADEKMRKNQIATGIFRYDFTEPQAVSCKHFQSQNRRSRVCEVGYWKDLQT